MWRLWVLIGWVVAPGSLAQTAQQCDTGTAESRFDCMVAQRCPTAGDDAAQAECFRGIALELLAGTPAGARALVPADQNSAPAVDQGLEATAQTATGKTGMQPPPQQPVPTERGAVAQRGVIAEQQAVEKLEPVVADVDKQEPVASAPVKPVPAAPATQSVTEAQAKAQFGLDWQEVDRVEVNDITARVTAFTRQPRGTYLFSLDNGQLWEQTEKRRLKLQPGDEIRIARMSLRSFKLFPARGVSCKVRRLDCSGADVDPRCSYFDGV